MGKLIKFVIELGIFAVVVSIVGRIVLNVFAGLFVGAGYFVITAIVMIALALKFSGDSKKNRKKDNFVGRDFGSNKRKDSGVAAKLLGKFLNDVEIKELDLAMRDYFRASDKLTVKEDLYLMPKDGVYKSLDALELWFKGEAIATIATLASEHPKKCKEIADFMVGRDSEKGGSSAAASRKAEEKEKETRAKEYIQSISAVNNGISDDAITEGLNQTERLLRVAHEMELNDPESEKLRKLYDQYLPILMSTLVKFMRLSEKAPLSRDYIDTKSKLTETVHLINEALYNITSEYYGGEMTDINVETRTLQSILKKDGVVGGGLVFPERLDEIVDEDRKLEVLEK